MKFYSKIMVQQYIKTVLSVIYLLAVKAHVLQAIGSGCTPITIDNLTDCDNDSVNISDASDNVSGTSAMYVGSAIPLVIYVAVLLFFTTLKKDLFLRLCYFINFNITLSLACSMLIFLININGAGYTFTLEGCETFTFFLHFWSLSVFMWMLCQAIHTFALTLYKYPDLENHKYLILAFPAMSYGGSFIISLITLLSRIKDRQYIINSFECWLSIEDGLYWGFLAPLLVITTIILWLLVISAFTWIRVFRKGTDYMTPLQEYELLKEGGILMITSLVLLPLMACTFGFSLGAINFGNGDSTAYCVFSIFLATAVVILFVLINAKTLEFYKDILSILLHGRKQRKLKSSELDVTVKRVEVLSQNELEDPTVDKSSCYSDGIEGRNNEEIELQVKQQNSENECENDTELEKNIKLE